MTLQRLVVSKRERGDSVGVLLDDGDRVISVRPLTDAESADLGAGPRDLYEILIERAIQTPQLKPFDALKRLEQSSTSLSAHALERARKIAQIIEREESPSPFVFPTEIGGIQFEWKGTSRALDLEVLPESEHLGYLTIVDGQPITEGEIVSDYERQVIMLLNWMRWR